MGLHWAMVHGSRSMVDSCAGLWWTASSSGEPRPPLSSLSMVHVHQVYVWVASEGGVPLFFSCGGAPAGGELTMSLPGGAGAQLGRGKATPGYGDCDGGVQVAARAHRGACHGERWLGSARRWRGRICRLFSGSTGQMWASADPWVHGKSIQGSRWGFSFKVAIRGSPVATATMKMTARHAGALRGSGGVVTVFAWAWHQGGQGHGPGMTP